MRIITVVIIFHRRLVRTREHGEYMELCGESNEKLFKVKLYRFQIRAELVEYLMVAVHK